MSVLRACVAIALLLAGCGGRVDEAPSTADAHADLELVTFPDGTSVELLYPPELEVAQLAVSPYTSGTLHGKSTEPGRSDFVARDFMIRHGDLDDVLDAPTGGGEPSRILAEYEGADGDRVGFWDVPWDDEAHYLGFQFGGWAVLVYDYVGAGAMTDDERASWAASFSGHETADGFLVLDSAGPLRLARTGEHAGPELTYSGVQPDRVLELFPGECRPHRDQTQPVDGKLVDWRGGFADWCVSGSMRAHATGSRDFVGALIRGLEVRKSP